MIIGMAIGLLSAVVPMYCGEIATAEDRGKLSGLLQFMLSWGFFVAQWLGYGCFQVDSPFQWRFPLSFQCGEYRLGYTSAVADANSAPFDNGVRHLVPC